MTRGRTYRSWPTCRSNRRRRAPRWEQFLGEIFAKDADLVWWFQKVVGYCLSGDTSEEMFFVVSGTPTLRTGRKTAKACQSSS